MHVKNQIRILGFDDGPFKKDGKRCVIIGCAFRGAEQLDGVLRIYVKVDGLDATEKLAKLIRRCKFKDARVVMLDGITYAGFNVVNIKQLSLRTNLPVIAIMRKKPNLKEFLEAMRRLPNYEERYRAVKDAGKIYGAKVECNNRKGKLYYQKAGIAASTARKIIKTSLKTSLYPEVLRIAHLIATGIVLGESLGRA